MRTFDWFPLRRRGLISLPWLVELGDDPSRGRGGLEGTRALSHEACHLFLIAHTGRTLGRTASRPTGAPRSYGDPALPDWFDEGVATLCEFPALRAQRRQQLGRVSDRTIPFADFFRMEHPLYAQVQALLAAQRAAAGTDTTSKPRGTTVQRLTIPLGGIPGLDAERGAVFYAQAHSVIEFLAERNGLEFVGLLGEALARGQSVDQVLARQVRSVPRDVSALEREWKAWLAKKG